MGDTLNRAAPTALEWSEDGVPFATVYGDHYFSRGDGQAECAHVFLAGNDLPMRWMPRERFRIGELGFGTGLNILETWRHWIDTRRPGQHLAFHSLEAHWLTRSDAAKALAVFSQLEPLAATLLSRWDDLGVETQLDDQTSLQVHGGEALSAIAGFSAIDAWYLDGFAPSRNPQMWSTDLMREVARRSAPGATIASFTAAGWVRRNLAEAGFQVAKRPGFGTKRDMIAGRLAEPSA